MSTPTTERVVVVTGGTRGIGLEIGRLLLQEGYGVIAVARNPTDEYEELRSLHGSRAEFMAADLGSPEGVDAVARRIRSCTGLYGMVNNAAVALSGLHVGLPRAGMESMLAVNLLAPMVLSQAAVKAMMRARTGRIVTVSSICAQRPYRGLGVYSATKAALEGFTRVLAAEAGPWGITANCVSPGFIDTAMSEGLDEVARGRIRRRAMLAHETSAGDAAAAVSFLLSSAAGAITAEVLRVDAGAAA
ncbi:SDR family NAD(P)-dependent oxidoreductase [Streptomyces drozdowiczii]|uniref:SDR family oxidoreductase n=1 Tax=Streptomyces drozdowiczii TaxID=202862 RepID=A0ABY6PP08_9ACTN|nr:SDR family oxidoreductase [Streptomyces drozdowiczii]MCX0246595.1 SDR family oxidoreductase [Streptomyces drozdowiczii]UZK53927.1 SDR family oxidoreductase [Streptomyces drozdowiczii]